MQYSLRSAATRAIAQAGARTALAALAVAVPALALQLLARRLSAAPFAARAALILAGAALALLGYVLYVRRVEQRRCSELALDRCASELAGGALLGAALFGATLGVLALCGALRIAGGSSPALLVRPLITAVSAGVLEELLFRAVLLRILETVLGSALALALSAAVFGLLHLLAPHASFFSAVAIMLEAGVLLGSAYFLTRRLWLPIGLHVAWNFTQGGVFGIAVSGHASSGWRQAVLSGPNWLSGGPFGAEASVAAIGVCLLAALTLLFLAARRGQLRPAPWRIPPAGLETRPAA